MAQEQDNRDLVLSPNEYSFIQDESNGNIVVYVGPFKTSLAKENTPIVFDANDRRYKRASLLGSIKLFPSASEGSYIILENPSEGTNYNKLKQGKNDLDTLQYGKKININGPITFPLLPGQIAESVKGHHLRSNQYLIARVYNEQEARENWSKAIMKPQTGAEVKQDGSPPSLVMGQLLIIKGTDTSFYIPPTGIEIIKEDGNYVRDAVSLENLEYCILLDEDGEKRFVYGPEVVFPEPTEVFIEKDKSRKFRAIELNELMGIYVKAIAKYKDGDIEILPGEEFFITGKDQKIYYPRSEHAIIRYGDQQINYAVAIPEGESRYALDKETGKIELVLGPKMYLPDPRRYVIVRRILSEDQISLWYPNNKKAIEFNEKLSKAERDYVSSGASMPMASHFDIDMRSRYKDIAFAAVTDLASNAYAGEELEREKKYTPPRTITLDTKFDGAPRIDVWTGYAVQIVDSAGKQKIVKGPNRILLGYDEILEHLELSTGVPKNDDNPIKTVYLRVDNNTVSDEINAETSDIVRVNVRLSYKVNFEEDSGRWFRVENYVKLLTDNMRSIIRNEIKKHGIEVFYSNAPDIIRNIVLGEAKDGKRPGRLFLENNMRIYDVEILGIEIGDDKIEDMLIEAQHEAVHETLNAVQKEYLTDIIAREENADQIIDRIRHDTYKKSMEIKKLELQEQLELAVLEITKETTQQNMKYEAKVSEQESLSKIFVAELKRLRDKDDHRLSVAKKDIDLALLEVQGNAKALVEKAKAITPDFIAALQSFANKDLAGKMAESMAPLAILGGKSIAEVFNNLLKGSFLEKCLTHKDKDAKTDK